MYKITIILLFLIGSVNGFSQRRHHIHLPDLPGYKTLKCDLHTHTIFSDGRLWPDVRVEEAWRDGLDAIALTDHINYKSPIIRKYLKCEDENAAYNEALFIARQLGVTLIKGAEINMSKDIGHFNVLFMDDLNEIKVVDKDYLRSLRKAKKKGAFVQWNHPLSKWNENHEKMYKEGLFDGLEIYNFNKIYKHACKWADDRKMIITCGSDIHYLMDMKITDSHRPMTLVFAEENTIKSIKEAIMEHRTAVYFADTIMGRMEHLKPLFEEGVSMEYMPRVPNKKNCYIHIKNDTDINFTLELVKKSSYVGLPKIIHLKANEITQVTMSFKTKDYIKKNTFLGVYKILNFKTLLGENLKIELNLDNAINKNSRK